MSKVATESVHRASSEDERENGEEELMSFCLSHFPEHPEAPELSSQAPCGCVGGLRAPSWLLGHFRCVCKHPEGKHKPKLQLNIQEGASMQGA